MSGDPGEGVDNGLIITGVSRAVVPISFEPVLSGAIDAVGSSGSLYLYGSVATGQATIPSSDVDLLTIGLDAQAAEQIAHELSRRHASVCRAVEIAAAQRADFAGERDEAYGNRVFLRHYCVHLAGPALSAGPPFGADQRAARGFNGDIAQHAESWAAAMPDVDRADVDGAQLDDLARTVARKTLLAVAGLVSVRDGTWTTDRHRSAERWAQIDPHVADGLRQLVGWIDGPEGVVRADLELHLASTVQRVVDAFAAEIGLWGDVAGICASGARSDAGPVPYGRSR